MRSMATLIIPPALDHLWTSIELVIRIVHPGKWYKEQLGLGIPADLVSQLVDSALDATNLQA
jgi:hypothetical protein